MLHDSGGQAEILTLLGKPRSPGLFVHSSRRHSYTVNPTSCFEDALECTEPLPGPQEEDLICTRVEEGRSSSGISEDTKKRETLYVPQCSHELHLQGGKT